MVARSLARVVIAMTGLVAPFDLCAQPLEVGVRAGRTWSSVTWDVPGPNDSHSNRSRRAVAAGAFARLRLWRGVSLQPELLLVEKGFERTAPTLHPTYLEVPLLLRVDTRGARLRGFLVAGPAAAYELRCRVSYATTSGPVSRDCDESVAQAALLTTTRALDLGVVVGGGASLRAGRGRVVLDLRHTRGVRDIQRLPQESARTLNRSTALRLGYAVPLGR
jgi:hypothetical protein